MKVIYFVIGFLIAMLLYIFSGQAEAKDVFSKMLPNGAVIVLTDEPCNLTYQGKPLTGNRSYGMLDGVTNSSCWVFKKGFVYIIWYESDNATVSGVNKYKASTFSEVKAL